jgi:hypothetical protein
MVFASGTLVPSGHLDCEFALAGASVMLDDHRFS